MRVDAIEITQHEGDTLHFRVEDKETGVDNVAALQNAIEQGGEFAAVDLDGRSQTIAASNIAEWEQRRVEDSAVTD